MLQFLDVLDPDKASSLINQPDFQRALQILGIPKEVIEAQIRQPKNWWTVEQYIRWGLGQDPEKWLADQPQEVKAQWPTISKLPWNVGLGEIRAITREERAERRAEAREERAERRAEEREERARREREERERRDLELRSLDMTRNMLIGTLRGYLQARTPPPPEVVAQVNEFNARAEEFNRRYGQRLVEPIRLTEAVYGVRVTQEAFPVTGPAARVYREYGRPPIEAIRRVEEIRGPYAPELGPVPPPPRPPTPPEFVVRQAREALSNAVKTGQLDLARQIAAEGVEKGYWSPSVAAGIIYGAAASSGKPSSISAETYRSIKGLIREGRHNDLRRVADRLVQQGHPREIVDGIILAAANEVRQENQQRMMREEEFRMRRERHGVSMRRTEMEIEERSKRRLNNLLSQRRQLEQQIAGIRAELAQIEQEILKALEGQARNIDEILQNPVLRARAATAVGAERFRRYMDRRSELTRKLGELTYLNLTIEGLGGE